GEAIRRRRECDRCGFRFRTFERKEETPLIIVKKDGTRQEFVREKLIRGLMRACEKRPVTIEEIEQVALEVEQEIRNSEQAEIDKVAYVRFDYVYRKYENNNFFLDELKEILQTKRQEKNEE